TTVAPGYVAEIAPSHIRGRLIAFRQLASILGLFLAGTINVLVMAVAGSSDVALALGLQGWHWVVLCLVIPAPFYIVFTSRIPESPRWLVAQGREDEAAAVLRRVTGDERPEGRVQEIRRSLGEGTTTMGLVQILRSRWRGLVLVGVAIAAFQQLT